MNPLNQLPGFQRSPPGLEWALLRRLPAILVIGLVVLHWTLVFTVAIGCVIVWLMKGPAYVADAYPPPEREQTE
jgi:uncharacterized Tic20 family protein